MRKHWQSYWVAVIDDQPVGFIGVVDGDIRLCTHPDHQRRGIARFMVTEIMRRQPNAFAKIKIANDASRRLFEACGFEPTFVIYEKAQ